MDKNKKLAGAIVLGLTGGIFVLMLANAQSARANFWDDIKNLFVAPGAKTPPPAPQAAVTPQVSLYEPAIDYEKAVVAAVKKASPAVVAITISKNVPIIENCPGASPFSDLPPEFRQFFGGDNSQFSVPCDSGKTQLQEIGGGSGFIISSDGVILTNKHVVADKNASYIVFTNDGKKYDAKVLARDPSQDLAVIKIGASNLTPVEIGDSDSVELGQTAIAIGNALGEFRNTVSVGVISGLSRTVTAGGSEFGTETIEGVIQTDAAINPGNSGGPLLNLRGQVIGINTAIASDAQNIGFAIPINRAKRDIKSVQSNGKIEVPFLGVRYIVITPDVKEKQKLPVDYGALVRGSDAGPAVAPGSPAAKAGIQAEDIILEVNGVKIDADHSLANEISKYNVGDIVHLKINRGGKEVTLNVTLTARPSE
jgi:serine protease Do